MHTFDEVFDHIPGKFCIFSSLGLSVKPISSHLLWLGLRHVQHLPLHLLLLDDLLVRQTNHVAELARLQTVALVLATLDAVEDHVQGSG